MIQRKYIKINMNLSNNTRLRVKGQKDKNETNKPLTGHKAVILAGGKGIRLYPITKEIPKPLLTVHKKPIINYLVDLFHSFGIKDIAVLINKEFKDDFKWWKKRYYRESGVLLTSEKKELGTFGGLYFLKDWLGNDLFFFTNGDELKKIDLKKMMDFHQKMGTLATMALVKVPDPQYYGVPICEKGIVKEYIEKPKNPLSNYVNAGLYIFSPSIFDYHPGPKFSMIEYDLSPKLAEEKKLSGFEFDGKWMDCGTWKRYNQALQEWK